MFVLGYALGVASSAAISLGTLWLFRGEKAPTLGTPSPPRLFGRSLNRRKPKFISEAEQWKREQSQPPQMTEFEIDQ